MPMPIIFEMANALIGGVPIELFKKVQQGQKTIDVRAYTPKYQAVRPGDKVVLKSISTGEMLERWVRSMYVVGVIGQSPQPADEILFDLFQMVAGCLDGNDSKIVSCLQGIVPGVSSVDEAKSVILSFPAYREKIEKYGAVAFRLAPVLTPY